MGPDVKPYEYIVKNFQYFVSLDFALYYSLTFQTFWILFYIVFATTIVSILLGIAYMINTKVDLKRFSITTKILDLCDVVLPLTCHLGFLSLTSMLMNIYLCIDGIGDNLNDSYLTHDCTVFCYTGDHLLYVVLTTIILSTFIILSGC